MAKDYYDRLNKKAAKRRNDPLNKKAADRLRLEKLNKKAADRLRLPGDGGRLSDTRVF